MACGVHTSDLHSIPGHQLGDAADAGLLCRMRTQLCVICGFYFRIC